MNTLIITSSIKNQIHNFITKFSKEYSFQSPEFRNKLSWYYSRDMYENNLKDEINPINTDWFKNLIVNATIKDLDELVIAYSIDEGIYPGIAFCLMRCIQQNLIEKAYKLDKIGIKISTDIPQWFRKAKWNCVEKWNCETVLN